MSALQALLARLRAARPSRETPRRWALPILLVAGVVVYYWPVLGTFFVGDDYYFLYHAQYEMNTVGGFLYDFWHTNVSGQFRPLVLDFFMWVGYQLFGMNPVGFHLLDLGVFLITTIVIFRLLERLTGSQWIALVACGVWAFSLTHYDALNWILAYAETGAILPAALCLGALSQDKPRWAVFWYVVCLFSNESVSIMPALATCYYFIWQRADLRGTLRRSLPLWITCAIYMLARFTIPMLHPKAQGAFTPVIDLGVWLSLIGKSFQWEAGFDSTFINSYVYMGPDWHTRAAVGAAIYLSAIGVVVLVGVIQVARLRQLDSRAVRLVLLGAAWFILGLVPVLPFANNYAAYNLALSLIGFSLVVAGLLVATKALAPALGGWLLCGFLAVSLISLHSSHGLVAVDGVTVLARASHSVYTTLTSYEQQHPGPFNMYVDEGSVAYWTINKGNMAYIIAPGSVACYVSKCYFQPGDHVCRQPQADCDFPPDIRFHFDPKHNTISLVP